MVTGSRLDLQKGKRRERERWDGRCDGANEERREERFSLLMWSLIEIIGKSTSSLHEREMCVKEGRKSRGWNKEREMSREWGNEIAAIYENLALAIWSRSDHHHSFTRRLVKMGKEWMNTNQVLGLLSSLSLPLSLIFWTGLCLLHLWLMASQEGTWKSICPKDLQQSVRKGERKRGEFLFFLFLFIPIPLLAQVGIRFSYSWLECHEKVSTNCPIDPVISLSPVEQQLLSEVQLGESPLSGIVRSKDSSDP